MLYCVYHTTYKGNKLPIFYIGSTSIESIESGYRGSVYSKKYKKIWKSELKMHPELFNTVIISTHATREEALNREEYIQKKLNVITNPLYINLSYAKGGFIREWTQEEVKEMSNRLIGNQRAKGNSFKLSENTKQKMRKPKSEEHRKNISKGQLGRKMTDDDKKKMSDKNWKKLARLKREKLEQEFKKILVMDN